MATATELYTAAIGQIYRRQTGREPDPDGLAYWLNLVSTGQIGLDAMERQLAASVEGQRYQSSFNTTAGGDFAVVRDAGGQHYLVQFGTQGGGTRYAISPDQLDEVIDFYGQPITRFADLPPSQRWNQIAQFGGDANTTIRVDGGGFVDGGPVDEILAGQRDARDAAERDDRSALAMIQEALDRYGLGSLADWAWSTLQGGKTYNEVMLELRQQEAFKERFKAIGLRQAAGLTPVSPEEILEYENTARDLMRQSGLPSGFYDQPDDFAELIGKGVSLQSVARRVDEAWNRVVNAPDEVREAFGQIYGMNSDQALAALFFDPDKSEEQLKRMASTAVAGGAMRTFGFDLDATAAARVAGYDLEDSSVRSGFAKIAQLRSVFTESVGERQDLDAMREGVDAAFDAGPGGDAIEDRITARRNAAQGGGGALLSQEGLAGTAR